ncbi:MAG TPA: DUF4149 domain-containing protein [Burkholderiaceae bacterium]|nr:DUF4149 domain-containing protein [Burkholderiaceae bacterium]
MLGHSSAAGVAGVMLFFTVAVAPTIFKVLPAEWAAVYVRAFFPKYYATLGAASLAAGLAAPDGPLRWVALACAAGFALSLLWLTPAINRASDAGLRRRFGWPHGGASGSTWRSSSR